MTNLPSRGLRSAFLILVFLQFRAPLDEAAALSVTAVPTIAALQALGTSSPSVAEVSIYNIGRYTWQTSCGGSIDGLRYVQATGVAATSCWALSTQYVTGNIIHVGGTTPNFSGDIGAQINSAYSALPVRGGTIVIDPNPVGGCYNFSTPISFSTLAKYVLLKGNAPGGADTTEGACMNFTPTSSSSAITIDNSSRTIGVAAPNNGLSDLTLVNNGCVATGGCGSSAIGINIGTSNGGDSNYTYSNVTIEGFGIGYNNLNQFPIVSTETWNNPNFQGNTTALVIAGQAERILSGVFAANGKVVVSPSSGRVPELTFIGTVFFDNAGSPNFDFTTNAGFASVACLACHFENTPSTNAHYFAGNVHLQLIAGSMEDDNATGTGDWMIQPGNRTVTNIESVIFNSARPYTTIVDISSGALARGSINATLTSQNNFPKLVDGSFAAQWNLFSTTAYSGTALGQQVGSPIKFPLAPVGLYANSLSNVRVDYPCTSISERGNLVIVLDANAPTFGNPIAGGGTTMVMAVCTGAGGFYNAY